jgi:RNA polymerase sigma-70 factor, ECF subfamily
MALTQEAAVEGLLANRAKLLAYIWSLLRDHHGTEDVFEEIVLLAMKNAAEITDQQHLLAWARRTARFRGIDHLRRERLQPVLLADDVLDQLEGHWGHWDHQSAAERIDALRQCVEQLTARSQQIIAMRYGRGMSGMQVAEALHQNVGTVYVALTRIYQSLQECLGRKPGG